MFLNKKLREMSTNFDMPVCLEAEKTKKMKEKSVYNFELTHESKTKLPRIKKGNAVERE